MNAGRSLSYLCRGLAIPRTALLGAFVIGLVMATGGQEVASQVMPQGTNVRGGSLLKDADFFLRGDANADGQLENTDAIAVLNFLFTTGEEPDCEKAGDLNDDGAIEVTDVAGNRVTVRQVTGDKVSG